MVCAVVSMVGVVMVRCTRGRGMPVCDMICRLLFSHHSAVGLGCREVSRLNAGFCELDGPKLSGFAVKNTDQCTQACVHRRGSGLSVHKVWDKESPRVPASTSQSTLPQGGCAPYTCRFRSIPQGMVRIAATWLQKTLTTPVCITEIELS